MAGITTLAQVPGMYIVIEMAAYAGSIVISERVIDMTSIALGRCVRTEQREFCQVVVEIQRVLPLRLRVTAFAAGAENSLVGIVSGVTGVA